MLLVPIPIRSESFIPDPGETRGILVDLPAMMSFDWILFIAGRIEGSTVECCYTSVAA